MSNGLFALGLSAKDYRLPHPKIPIPVILLIRRVFLHAFEILRKRHHSLARYKEDELTAALCAVIENDLRQKGSVPGFNRTTFDSVERQSEVTNFNLTKLAKKPDLRFKLRSDEEEPLQVLSEHWALFVECKPVDHKHPAGSQYCDLGIARFVDGDYAWAMEQGLMVGYVRGRTIAAHLLPAILEVSRKARLGLVQEPEPMHNPGAEASAEAEALHLSRHRRNFRWPDGKGAATEITLYHSWHRCD